MLQLLTGEYQPRAEHHIAQIRVYHREEHIVDLQDEADHVEHAVTGIPRIERLDGQTWYLHGDGRIRIMVYGKLDTLPEERNRCPGRCRGKCGQHDEEKQFPHLGQRNGMIASIRFGEKRMRICLIPYVEGSGRAGENL